MMGDGRLTRTRLTCGSTTRGLWVWVRCGYGYRYVQEYPQVTRADPYPPVKIPVIPHTPWIKRNILIPPGIYDEVCTIICKKIESGIYERSNSTYHSRWFCTLKKDGKALCIVHSLEPLNRVTI